MTLAYHDTQHTTTLSIMGLFKTLSINDTPCKDTQHNVNQHTSSERCYAECHYAEGFYADCRYPESRYAEGHCTGTGNPPIFAW